MFKTGIQRIQRYADSFDVAAHHQKDEKVETPKNISVSIAPFRGDPDDYKGASISIQLPPKRYFDEEYSGGMKQRTVFSRSDVIEDPDESDDRGREGKPNETLNDIFKYQYKTPEGFIQAVASGDGDLDNTSALETRMARFAEDYLKSVRYDTEATFYAVMEKAEKMSGEKVLVDHDPNFDLDAARLRRTDAKTDKGVIVLETIDVIQPKTKKYGKLMQAGVERMAEMRQKALSASDKVMTMLESAKSTKDVFEQKEDVYSQLLADGEIDKAQYDKVIDSLERRRKKAIFDLMKYVESDDTLDEPSKTKIKDDLQNYGMTKKYVGLLTRYVKKDKKAGQQAPPQGQQAPPQGQQAPPQGQQVPPQGGQQAPSRSASAPSRRNVEFPQRVSRQNRR